VDERNDRRTARTEPELRDGREELLARKGPPDQLLQLHRFEDFHRTPPSNRSLHTFVEQFAFPITAVATYA
jgi:hypothetical protein